MASCPHCQAVLYGNPAKCYKCGEPIGTDRNGVTWTHEPGKCYTGSQPDNIDRREGPWTCDICGGTFAENEGTGIDGYAYHETVTHEAATRSINRWGFTPLSVWWCHRCFDERDLRRARRALRVCTLIGLLVPIAVFFIALAASGDFSQALLVTLVLGGPCALFSFLWYLGARPCAGRRGGRANQTGIAMLHKRACERARASGFTWFMTREEYKSIQGDPNVNWLRFPPA